MTQDIFIKISSKMESEGDQIRTIGLEIDFAVPDMRLMNEDKSSLTDDAIDLYLRIITNAISELARSSSKEGPLVEMVISKLEDNLVDALRKPPTTSISHKKIEG